MFLKEAHIGYPCRAYAPLGSLRALVFHETLRVQVPNNHILPQTCTTITVTQNPSTLILGSWTLGEKYGPKPLSRCVVIHIRTFGK